MIDKLDKQENMLKIRQTNIHTEKRGDRKIIRKLKFTKSTFTAKTIKMKYVLKSKTNILHVINFGETLYS